MKIALSFLFVFLFVFVSFTQPVKNKYFRETPGDELQVYSIHHYRGMIATAVGAPTLGFGLYLLNDSKKTTVKPTYNVSYNNGQYTQELTGYQTVNYIDKKREKEGIFGVMVGGIITSVGMYYLIESPIHLKRAGILLNENGVGIKIKLE